MKRADPEHVAAILESMRAEVPTPGKCPAKLIGGPFDGATLWLSASEVLRVARGREALCVELEPTGEAVAMYQAEPVTGALRDGFRGRFVSYGVFVRSGIS